jgi:ABC-type transport system substrate-binding protein
VGKSKVWRLVAVMAALAVPLSACTASSGGSQSQSQSGPSGTLNVGLETLGAFACAPRLTSSADTGRTLVMSGAYDTLVRLNAQGKYVGDLATSWGVSKDGTTWTFHLRHGVQFDMGYGEMTSADVVYSLQQAAATGSLNGNAGSLDRLFKKVTAVGKYTVQINTGTPQSDMLNFLRNDFAGAAYIVSKKQADKVGVNATAKVGCAGTGPWQFVQAKSDQYWKFKAVSTNKWHKTPSFKYLVLWEVPEEATRVAEFQSGQLDIILADPDSIATVKGAPGVKLATTPAGVDFHLGFYGNYYSVKRPGYDPSLPYVSSSANTNSAAWKRAVKVREAMSIAIDRQSIVTNLLHGAGQTTALWGWGASQKYLPSNIKWNYSPAEAKKLLAQA